MSHIASLPDLEINFSTFGRTHHHQWRWVELLAVINLKAIILLKWKSLVIKFRCIVCGIAVLPKCSAILNKSKAKYTLSCDSAVAKRVHLSSIRPQRDWPCPGHVMDSYHKLGFLLSPWPAFRL